MVSPIHSVIAPNTPNNSLMIPIQRRDNRTGRQQKGMLVIIPDSGSEEQTMLNSIKGIAQITAINPGIILGIP